MKRALLLLLCACGRVPPDSITVSPELPEPVQVAAARARDIWCAVSDRTGWCPDLVDEGGQARLHVGHFADEKIGAKAHTDQGSVELSPDAATWDVDALTGVLAHEYGHLGIEGEVPHSPLMCGFYDSPLDIPWAVDTLALSAWCDQQECL
jgi:hypothetical protein